MLDKLCRDPAHLEKLLKRKLSEEKELNVLKWLNLDNIQDLEEWKESVYWLTELNRDCGFQCETFALAVHVLDSFLGFVKVHGKYLKCATLAAFYIAIKILEEEEFIPPLATLVTISGNKFTANDIVRMETIILEKLGWCLPTCTMNTFLEIFFSLVCAQHFKTLFGSDSLAYSIYRNITTQSQQCLSCISLLKYKGSLQALALLSCTLEKMTSRWLLYVEQLATIAKMDKQELLECRDIIKTVVFGQQKRLRPPRVKKFVKRRAMLTPRRLPLSPIVENPLETEYTKQNQVVNIDTDNLSSSLDKVIECVSAESNEKQQIVDTFNEELRRLRKISLDEMQLPSPAKRRKIMSCSVQSKLDQDAHMLTSPIKPMPV